MDATGFSSYKGYCFKVSAHSTAPQEWRGTVDILRKLADGSIEAVISHRDIPGRFPSESAAWDAAIPYALAIIDGVVPGLDE